MQTAPAYSDVVQDISEFLSLRLADMGAVGIDLDRVVIDPGFGFGKTAEQNFELLARLEALCNQRQPVLVGLSRKSMISSVLDRPPEQRMVASVALALMAVERGARIVRVHDIAATFDALSMWQTIRHTLSQSQQP
jgi:dihydropteroate synthase